MACGPLFSCRGNGYVRVKFEDGARSEPFRRDGFWGDVSGLMPQHATPGGSGSHFNRLELGVLDCFLRTRTSAKNQLPHRVSKQLCSRLVSN